MVEIAKCTLVVAVVAAGLGSASVTATTVRHAPRLDTRPAGATFVVSDIGRFRLSDPSGGAMRLRPVEAQQRETDDDVIVDPSDGSEEAIGRMSVAMAG